MSLFRPNLDTRGRRIRAVGAFSMAVAAVLTWPRCRTGALVLGGSAAFVAFEAARGWCVLRACGVKTRF